jgi:hypothetical protein
VVDPSADGLPHPPPPSPLLSRGGGTIVPSKPRAQRSVAVRGALWLEAGDVSITVGTLECLDAVGIYDVQHFIRERVPCAQRVRWAACRDVLSRHG